MTAIPLRSIFTASAFHFMVVCTPAYAADGPPTPTPLAPEVPEGGFPRLEGGDASQGAADLAGTVEAGDPLVLGGISDQAIHDVIRHNLPSFLTCYSEGLARDPNARGTVTLKWLIKFSGRPEAVEIKASTLGDPAVEGCLLVALSGLTFPAPARGHVLASYPLTFTP